MNDGRYRSTGWKVVAAALWLAAALCAPSVLAQSTFSSDRLTEAARRHVQQLAGPTAAVEQTGNIPDQTFSQTGVQAQIRDDSPVTGAVHNVVIDFTHNGRTIRQVSIPFRIARSTLVPVAATSLPAGTVLTAEHVRMQERPAQSVRSRTAVSADDVIGRKLTAAVSPDEPLTTDNLTSPGGITRGQTVTLVVRSGSIVITTQARALSDARPGESLTVVRTRATAAIRVTALGDGIVELRQ